MHGLNSFDNSACIVGCFCKIWWDQITLLSLMCVRVAGNWWVSQCVNVYLLIGHFTGLVAACLQNKILLLLCVLDAWNNVTDKVVPVPGSQLTIQDRSSSDICCGYLTWPVVCASTIWAVRHLECGKGTLSSICSVWLSEDRERRRDCWGKWSYGCQICNESLTLYCKLTMKLKVFFFFFLY